MQSFEEWVIEYATERDGGSQAEILEAVATYFRTHGGERLLATLDRIHESSHQTCVQISQESECFSMDRDDDQWEAG